MTSNNIVIQLGVVLLAGGIGYFFIYPMLQNISVQQDQIGQYSTETERVAAVNTQLQTLVQRAETISVSEQRVLERYLPAQIDDVAIMRDIYAVAETAGVIVSAISQPVVNNQAVPAADDAWVFSTPSPYKLSVSVSGTYEQIKTLLYLLELNVYALNVQSLQLTGLEGGFLTAQIELETYQFIQPIAELST